MEILVKRLYKKEKYTIGNIYINGMFVCNSLEDKDRGLNSKMSLEEIKKIKVYGETAIPTGRYKVNMNVVSPTFKNRSWAKLYDGKIPRLENVPGYDGVLIHVGNDQSDTSGCILCGDNTAVGKVLNSTLNFHKIMTILKQAKEDIYITIE